jgi:hypothetical protein
MIKKIKEFMLIKQNTILPLELVRQLGELVETTCP